MGALLEEFFGRAVFYDLSGVHDGDFVGHLGNDAEVVRDEEHRHAAFLLELAQEIENLRLDSHVECGGGFIGDEDFGVAGERHGDHDALSHAAGHLVRVIVDAGFGRGDADLIEEIDGGGAGIGLVKILMESKDRRDLGADTVDGVQ